MTSLSSLSLAAWVEALAGPRAVPAGGALALATLAGASGLAAKVLSAGGRDPSPFDRLPAPFLAAADEDAEAYRRAVREGGSARVRCLEVGLEHLESAADFLEHVRGQFAGLPDPLAADLAAAQGLGRAAARALLVNLAVNLSAWAGALPREWGAEALRRRLDAARDRLGEG